MKTRLLIQLINNEGTDPIQTATNPPLCNHTELLGKYQFLRRLMPHVNTGEDINEHSAGIFYLGCFYFTASTHTGKKIALRPEQAIFGNCQSSYEISLILHHITE